jgi:urate oxidase
MGIRLGQNNYGKSRVRLLRVARQEGRHEIAELTLAIRFEGDFETAHTKGDNRSILPTDTMKNTVYVLARQHPIDTVEDFSLRLVDHFLSRNPQVRRVRIETAEEPWARICRGGKPHASAFASSGAERRTAILDGTRESTTIRAGLENLVVLKTTKSAFVGFLRDSYTTLKEDRNRILSTTIRATWLYGDGKIDFGVIWRGVRQTLLEIFAEHESGSLQHTLYGMGEAVLAQFGEIREIHLSLPNKHYNLVNLAPFELDNPAEVFLPTDEPHGLIEATLERE